MVGVTGLEPATSRPPAVRATNCATPRQTRLILSDMAQELKACYNMVMLLIEFISWWYGRGYMLLFKKLQALIISIWQKFSVATLVKTLVDPWRRIVTDPGKSLQDKSRAILDNAVSRVVGFTIRVIVIISAFISIALLFVVGLLLAVAWPLAPVLIILPFVLAVT